MKKLNLVTVLIIFALLAAAFTPTSAVLAQDGRTASVIPTLKSPINTIVTRTPTYTWTKVASATKYQYQVYVGTVKKWDKVVYASACGSSNCAIKPAFTLGFIKYKWRVRAMVSNTWFDWSGYKYFTVSGPSFNSEFNSSMSGWAKLGTNPWYVNATEMYTTVGNMKYANIYRTTGKYADFDYSVRMKSNASNNNSTVLSFRMGSSINPTSDLWYPGYKFIFRDGYLAIVRYDENGNGVALFQGSNTSTLKPYDWNVIRVIAYGDVLNFFINGTLITTEIDDYYLRGYVGISMAPGPSSSATLSVDWARLSVLGKLADYETLLGSR